ncbi:GIN domain-containing protein [Aquimarina mytili]|uniref:DUF2807 domain-containing protein n=1 Tax=Aquimarina mytili TaxID=874423 RepID=A0A937A2Y2_9FLAO|nr:DUF2807 domain-containing protein [Aquimarina mytili]MBL0683990.1 DUF2807 domain-containing protein [Aquimarina mytili]
MKKSNLIVIVAISIMAIFFMAFQFSIHRYVRNGAIENIDTSEFVSETRNVKRFKKMSLNHGITVFFIQDGVTDVQVKAPQNLMPYIKTEVKHEKLIIEKTKRTNSNDSIVVFVANNLLDSLKVSSGAYFETIGPVSGNDIKLQFNDDSKGNLALSYKIVKCNVDSDAKVKITGDSKEIDFNH